MMTTQTLLDFDLDESSSDSDFRIEDEDHDSDDDFSGSNKKGSGNSEDDDSDGDDESDDDSDDLDEETDSSSVNLKKVLESPPKQSIDNKNLKDILLRVDATTTSLSKQKIPTKPICCACLGDRSDDSNEIVECDGCGVSVHEGCYGVSDSNSISSTTSSCSTEPWFCEACRAGVTEPHCELCPNLGGIFKETDVGKWVHLVCALYVPGVAFGEVDQLSSVTLFEMQYSRWGAKICSLCENERYARTGICIGCDAGMCKTFFHVTCAQAAGFLSEAHSDEADHADPFYAHCKVHSDKTMIKHRKRNYNMFKFRMEQKQLEKVEVQIDDITPERLRIQRKLSKYQLKYKNHKSSRNEPWVPTQKMSRLITSSATACNRLTVKAQVMGIDIESMERQEVQIASITDIRKKWHIPPAFSVEFIAYYLDRISRLKELKTNVEKTIESNKLLTNEQQNLRNAYDSKADVNSELKLKNEKLQNSVREIHKQIESLCPNKSLPTIENIGRPILVIPSPITQPARPMSVPTAAALKMGVGFPLAHLPGTKDDTGRILSTQSQNKNELVHECGICKRCNDQHMLAKCDTCHFYYHLGCLNPPLTRHPKKSKLYGWQCSECDKSDDSDAVVEMPKGPRKSRTRFSKDGTIVPVDPNLSSSNPETSMSPKAFSPGKRKASIDAKPAKRKSIDKPPDTNLNGKLLSVSIGPFVVNSKSSEKIKKKSQPAAVKKMSALSYSEEPLSNSLPTLNQKNDNDNSPTPVEIKNSLEIDGQSLSATKILKSNKQHCNNKKSINKMTTELLEKLPIIPIPPSTNVSAELSENNESLDLLNQQNSSILEGTTFESIASITSNDVSFNTDLGTNQTSKHNRKKRKDKHKSKYSSDNEKNSKTSNKEHKRKRKKKNHDIEKPNGETSLVPKIKIKFKTLPLPGEVAPEPQFFYVSADMVRPTDASRPTSVETVEDSILNPDDVSQNASSPFLQEKSTVVQNSRTVPTTPTKLSTENASTPKSTPKRQYNRKGTKRGPRLSTTGTEGNSSQKSTISNCDVCHQPGTNQNLVMCDECRKNYHFACLDPPLKKSPKRRGYSWHCADCDPTDHDTM